MPGKRRDEPMPAHIRGEVKQASENSPPPRCQEQQAFDKQFKNNLSGKDIAAPSIGIGVVFALPCPCQLAAQRVAHMMPAACGGWLWPGCG